MKFLNSARLFWLKLLFVGIFCCSEASASFVSETEIWTTRDELDRSCPGRDIDNVATIFFPKYHRNNQAHSDGEYKIEFDNFGRITLDGSDFDANSLDKILENKVGHLIEIELHPSEYTPVGSVLPILKTLNKRKYCYFGIVGNEAFSAMSNFSISDARKSRLSNRLNPFFYKKTDLVITLDYGPTLQGQSQKRSRRSSNSGTCRAVADGTSVDPLGIFKVALQKIALAEKHFSSWSDFNDVRDMQNVDITPTAIVQVKKDIPWQCVAAAVFNAQMAGYSIVDLEMQEQ
jgi:hypothetical protein